MSTYDDAAQLLALIQRLYAAPGTVDGWQDFLLDLSTHLDATGAVVLSHDLRSRRGSVQAYAGFDPDVERGYLAHWGALDPWAYNPVIGTLTSGEVAIGEQLVPHDQMRRTQYYNDFGRQHGIAHCIAGMVEVEPHAFSCLTLNGPEKRGAFGRQEAALLKALMPHLQRALQIHRRLSDADERADNASSALDSLAHGVLLVDRSARVLFANRAAEDIMRGNDGLSMRNRKLFGARTQDTNTLRSLVAQAAGTTAGRDAASGGLALVARRSGRAALRVLVTPVVRRHPLLGHEAAAACVFITDPECRQTPAPEHLQRAFAFTPAETRVAMAMLDGESVEQLADRLCISRNTARTHLRRLFAKTDTTRQADLIRVLLGAHAPVRFD